MARIAWRNLLGRLAQSRASGFASSRRPARRGWRGRPIGAFEQLEQRMLLAGDMIELGPSDNIALDQPRVAFGLWEDPGDPATKVGPEWFNTFLLDTGANSVLAMATAVSEMLQPPYVYQTEGTFIEQGVAGDHPMDVSAEYLLGYSANGNGWVPNELPNVRILSDENNDFSSFGPWGIVGMPAMTDRVTSLDFTVWSNQGASGELYMTTTFGDAVPADPGHRYSVSVDNRLQFYPEDGLPEGSPPGAPLPVWADVPFLTAIPTHNGVGQEGNFLFDTGAQMSVISEHLGIDIGLDSNGDGVLDDLDDNFLLYETVGGVGGQIPVPVFAFDEVRLPTEEGVELVWTDLQWLVLDIPTAEDQPSLDGVFGSDLLTSGWFYSLFYPGQPDGYVNQVHFDFREWGTGSGTLYFDLNPDKDVVIEPGPGVRIRQSNRSTEVIEGGLDDTYTVVLTGAPLDDVTIDLANPDGQLTVYQDPTPGDTSLVFTPSDWDTPQTVRVVAVDDTAAEGPHTGLITHTVTSADSNYNGMDVPDLTVGVVDNDLSLVRTFADSAGLVEITSIDVAEGGGTVSYWVALESSLGSIVYVEFADPTGQVEPVNPNAGIWDPEDAVEFGSGDWNVPKEVEVTAYDDSAVEGPHQTQIVHTVYVVDPITWEYEIVGQSAFAVNISDNDIGVVVKETGGSTHVTESGYTDTYTVVLGKQPTAEVTIELGTADGQLTAVDDANPANDFLVFNGSNWDTPQTVRVRAVDDEDTEGTHSGQITHTATSADSGYNGIAIGDVTASITDNDVGLIITETDGSTDVTEGGPADTYTVALTTQPTDPVRIYLNNADGQVTAVDDANPGNAFLDFTTSNWSTPQTVRVTAIDDDLVETPQTAVCSISHEGVSQDTSYQGNTPLAINVTDNDTCSVVGRYVFYDNSYWDGYVAGPNSAGGPGGNGDDDAVATDKQALLPGQTASFENYVSYHLGVIGIMVDIAGLPNDGAGIDASDFAFKVGNSSDPDDGTWTTVTVAPTVDVRQLDGNHRITLTWDSSQAPTRSWLQGTVRANGDTGLATPDVFYFGYSAGEANGDFVVDYGDAFDAIWPALFGPTVGVESPLDINRDHVIDYGDVFSANTVWDNLFDLPPLAAITAPAASPSSMALLGGGPGEALSATRDLQRLDEAPSDAGHSDLPDLEDRVSEENLAPTDPEPDPADPESSDVLTVEEEAYPVEIEETVSEEYLAAAVPETDPVDPDYSDVAVFEPDPDPVEIEETVPEEHLAAAVPEPDPADPESSHVLTVEEEAYLVEIEETVPEQYSAPADAEPDPADPESSHVLTVEEEAYLVEIEETVPEEYLAAAVPEPDSVDPDHLDVPTVEEEAYPVEIEETVPEEHVAPAVAELDSSYLYHPAPARAEADAYSGEPDETEPHEHAASVSAEDAQWEPTSVDLLLAEAIWLWEHDASSKDQQDAGSLDEGAVDDVLASCYSE